MATLEMKFPNWRGKVLTLSYDDGTVHDIKMVEILNKYGLKAAFHLNASMFFPEDGERKVFDGRMKLSEAKKLYCGSGHEVAAHGLTHAPLAALTDTEALHEITEDRKILEREFGMLVKGFAYSYGSVGANSVEILKACGIQYARCSGRSGNFAFPPANWLQIHSTCHHEAENLMELAQKFVESKLTVYRNMMFFMYGHSYEFNRDDNWDLLERFAEYMGGREDIWYATPGEIWAYHNAFKALERSADGHIIHNPTNQTVYAIVRGDPAHDGEKLLLEPGWTVVL